MGKEGQVDPPSFKKNVANRKKTSYTICIKRGIPPLPESRKGQTMLRNQKEFVIELKQYGAKEQDAFQLALTISYALKWR
jgi:hypothetical protein